MLEGGDYQQGHPSKGPRRGGWGVTGQLTPGQTTKTVDLQVNFPDSETYTIQFLIEPPDPSTGVVVIPNATISWAVEGGFVFRTISVTNGVSISGRGQGVKVRVSDFSNFPVPPFVPQPYNITILITRGVRASYVTPPTLVVGRTVVGVAGVVTSNVPINPPAGVASVEVTVARTTAGNPAPSTKVQHLVGTTILKEYDPLVNIGFVALAPGATQVKVINFDAANSVVVSITWGIEG